MNYKKHLQRNILWLLAIKLLALMLIQQIFFSDRHRVTVDDEQVEHRFFVGKSIYEEK